MSHLLPIFKALGTSWVIEIFGEVTTEKRQIIFDDLTLFISEFEQKYSRFRSDSLLSKLNSTGRFENAPLDFIETIKFGVEIFDRTDGVMNLLVGSALNAIGYDSDYSFTPSSGTFDIPNPHKAITINEGSITLHDGSIDIGGYGKGLLIDLVGKRLVSQHFIPYFLINGGGDMFATSDNGAPIEIYLEHPTEPNTYLATTTLYNQGFAASSPHKRSWVHNTQTYSHIINTKSTKPDNIPPDATFIKAKNAVTADIFATTALIVSAEELGEFANKEHMETACYSLVTKKLLFNNGFVLN